jgi:hypothetical protein
VIDNTSVVLAGGGGAQAVFAPEMVAFAATLGFAFMAHRVQDPNRKGRIERPFFYVQTNFLDVGVGLAKTWKYNCSSS